MALFGAVLTMGAAFASGPWRVASVAPLQVLEELLTVALSLVVVAAALALSAWIAVEISSRHGSPQDYSPLDAEGAEDLGELRLRYERTWELYRRLAPLSDPPLSVRRLLRLTVRYSWARLRLRLRLGSLRRS